MSFTVTAFSSCNPEYCTTLLVSAWMFLLRVFQSDFRFVIRADSQIVDENDGCLARTLQVTVGLVTPLPREEHRAWFRND